MEHPVTSHSSGKADKGLHIFGRPAGLVFIVAYKGLWGLAELLVGILLISSSKLIVRELSEDPQDLFINWWIHHVRLDFDKLGLAGVLVAVFGIVKIVMAVGVWVESYLIRRIAIICLSLFAIFAFAELEVHFTLFRLLALAADLAIIYYFWKILPRHFRHGTVA